MIKQVAIFGDSWAYSSHKKMPNGCEALSNLTFQDLFKDNNISADNYAIRGGTNLDTINQIQNLTNDYDLLIVFQTDPVRQYMIDLAGPNITINKQLELPQTNNFTELCEALLADFYEKLAQFNKPILLIGGCTKLCFKHVPKSITTLPQSWTELMFPDFSDNYVYWLEPALGLYDHARQQLKWSSSLADFHEFEKQIYQKNHLWQTSDHFSWTHSGDSAYQDMFKKIMEIINDPS